MKLLVLTVLTLHGEGDGGGVGAAHAVVRAAGVHAALLPRHTRQRQAAVARARPLGARRHPALLCNIGIVENQRYRLALL